jgi:hypothetical protein
VTYLGRQAQGGEEMGFVNQLQAGQSEEQVLSQILGSTEFFNHAQTLGFSGSANAQFVQALYQLLLNRTPGTAEVNAQVAALTNGVSRQTLALGFLQSQEYRGDAVAADYANLLHRTGSANDVNAWVFSNLDLASIRLAFEGSAEFFTNG